MIGRLGLSIVYASFSQKNKIIFANKIINGVFSVYVTAEIAVSLPVNYDVF